MKEIVKTNNAPEPIGPYNQAVWAGDTLYMSGQIAIDPKTGQLITSNIEDETELVMKNIGAVLSAAGTEFSKVVKCSIFLSDMELFGQVNEIYGRFFSENSPARETVAVRTLPKNVNVEISVIALR
ncbi:MAG TPA: reactive intermediate/imine deaminase [Flavobacteriales bacterium]|jgi:2-iminobutanoate/2-iminopropanoate deaminase|nr:reactive intermediate/imine deaminase [Flavobacteriales bacterium]